MSNLHLSFPTPMTAIKLYFLLLLCATHSLSHSLSSFTKSHIFSNLPILNAYATKKGNVPIYKDNNGFYVQVDLSDDFYEASDSTLGPWTVEMMLGLYTSHTLLAQDCLDFQSYNCSSDTSCVVGDSQPADYDFPSFSTAAYLAWLNMFLDYNNWDFKDLSLIATSCKSNVTLPYGSSRSGIVGLGIADGAATNFDSFEVFSIHIDEDMLEGILMFGTDLDSYAASSSATATLLTDENWTTSALGKIQIGDTELALNATILLDINEDTVGFPLALYQQIISSLNTVMDFECSSDTAYPTCPYTGSVSGLPDIVLNLDGQSIPIPGSAYAKGATGDGTGVILNMRGYSSSLNGTSFVTKTYENCIILGYNFLANYYTVFNGTSETSVTITLYPTATPSSSPSWLITLIEVLGALAFVLICICLYCVCRKKFKRKTRPRNQVGPESATAPLMVGYNPTSMVYTNYDSTHEHGQSIMNGTFSHQLDSGEHEVRGRFRTGLRSSQNLGQRHMERPVDSIAEDED